MDFLNEPMTWGGYFVFMLIMTLGSITAAIWRGISK
jgi:hypothetical protein